MKKSSKKRGPPGQRIETVPPTPYHEKVIRRETGEMGGIESSIKKSTNRSFCEACDERKRITKEPTCNVDEDPRRSQSEREAQNVWEKNNTTENTSTNGVYEKKKTKKTRTRGVHDGRENVINLRP